MTDPLFSLVAGEGDGAILGLAAGDTAGGAWELGYSAITQQAVVVSYELIENSAIDHRRLVDGLVELDGGRGEEPVYRHESPEFRAWLDRAAVGSVVPEEAPSTDPLGRSGPLGVFYQRDAGALYQEAIAMNRIFHNDAGSILGGVIVASAVAASCFGQVGRDLLLGIAEGIQPAVDELADAPGLVGSGDVVGTSDRILGLVDHYGVTNGDKAISLVAEGAAPTPLDQAIALLLIVAPTAERSHDPVAEAARLAGGNGGAGAGAILGARVGIRAWPWAFANDTWFAEIGRRLARGPNEIRDLPIPYAVEQHLNSGVRQS